MERIKSFLKNAFSYPRLLVKSHPVTAISIIASAVIFAIYNVFSSARYDLGIARQFTAFEIFFHIGLATAFFAAFALCFESIGAKLKKAAGYAILAVLCVLSFFMSFILADFYEGSHVKVFSMLSGIKESFGTVTVFLHVGGLLALALVFAVYFSYIRNVHESFNVHFTDISSKLFFTSIIYSVIQLGVLFLTLIVTLLLYEDAFRFLFPVIILINGLFYVPAVVCYLTRQNEHSNIFYNVLVRYVMLTIVILAYFIIYIYMIKLVVTASVPSNSVYAILTALFVISMLVTYMCTSFEEAGFLQKFAYNSPLVFAPFILMQCYTVFVRIGQYGLTPKRYFGIAFILFEASYIIYYVAKRRRDKEIIGSEVLFIISAFLIITIFVPGINARALSNTFAKRTISSYLEKLAQNVQISDSEYIRTNAAYGFLTDKSFGDGDITARFSNLDDNTIRDIKNKAKDAKLAQTDSRTESDFDFNDISSGWFTSDMMEVSGSDRLDISDYSSLVHIRIHDPDATYDSDHPADTSSIPVYVYNYNNNEKLYTDMPDIDLTDFCKQFVVLADDMNNNIITTDEFRDSVIAICTIDVNENVRLYITNADISHNKSGAPVNVDIEGYLLIR